MLNCPINYEVYPELAIFVKLTAHTAPKYLGNSVQNIPPKYCKITKIF